MGIECIVSGIWNSYIELQKEHQLIGAAISAEIVYPIGEALSHLIKYRKIHGKQVLYKMKLAPVYGVLIHYLEQTGEPIDLFGGNALAKAALGPGLWSNLYNAIFFANDRIGKDNDYSVTELGKHYLHIFNGESVHSGINGAYENFKENFISKVSKKEYAISVAATLTVWNGIQWYNFYHVSQEMRTQFIFPFVIGWGMIMSAMSLTGRTKAVNAENK